LDFPQKILACKKHKNYGRKLGIKQYSTAKNSGFIKKITTSRCFDEIIAILANLDDEAWSVSYNLVNGCWIKPWFPKAA
jgi:hypothetical protein